MQTNDVKKTSWLILASGEGTSFEYLFKSDKKNNYEIIGVISSSPNAGVVARAKSLGVQVKVVAHKATNNSSQNLIAEIDNFNPDFILLAGYLKKINEDLINKFRGRIFNSHPSLLPKYGGHGMYGSSVHKAVFANNESVTGVTIHEVNEELDQGRVVFQKPIDIKTCKSWEEVESLVKALEKDFLVECLNKKKVEWTGG